MTDLQLSNYDVETELAAYDDAEDFGIIDDEQWTEMVARFIRTFSEIE